MRVIIAGALIPRLNERMPRHKGLKFFDSSYGGAVSGQLILAAAFDCEPGTIEPEITNEFILATVLRQ